MSWVEDVDGKARKQGMRNTLQSSGLRDAAKM